MAGGTADIVFRLELSEREASALCEALVGSSWDLGEGEELEKIYNALMSAGAEHGHLVHRVVENELVIEFGEGGEE